MSETTPTPSQVLRERRQWVRHAAEEHARANNDAAVHRLRQEEMALGVAIRALEATPLAPLDYLPGTLDYSAPARVWLQIDTSADNSERDEPWPKDGAEGVSWHYEPLGGLEIEYLRADLARIPLPPRTWLPIDTAPKDNKRPLYLARFHPETGELQGIDWDGSWQAESESWEQPQVYHVWRSAHDSVEEPTHWAYQDETPSNPAPLPLPAKRATEAECTEAAARQFYAEGWNARGAALQAAALPAEMSPEFTDTARAALAWVLYHHQGGSSPVGQPIRLALGMGQHDRLSDQQISDAKRWAAIYGKRTSDFHAALPAVPEGMRVVGRVQRGPAPHDPLYALILPGVDDSTIPEGTPLYALAAALPAVPDGWKLVPERMHLSVESLEALSLQCGGVDPESTDLEERWCSGTLWVGDILDDDGRPTHGLHLSNDECPEEGSMTLVEFAATPAHDQPEGER